MPWAAHMAMMTPGRWINLAAAALGAIGAIVLFNGRFAYESFSPWQSRDGKAVEAQTKRNLRRQLKQRIGLGLILVSFVLQGIAQFFRLSARSMIRIAITQAAFEAIAKTLPLGTVAYEPAVDEGGLRYIWLEPRWLDPVKATGPRFRPPS